MTVKEIIVELEDIDKRLKRLRRLNAAPWFRHMIRAIETLVKACIKSVLYVSRIKE